MWQEQEMKEVKEIKNSVIKNSEMKSSEIKSSKINVLLFLLLFKRKQICLQRFIYSEEDVEIIKLKLLETVILLWKSCLQLICKFLDYLSNLMYNWVMRNEINQIFWEESVYIVRKGCIYRLERCTNISILNNYLA